MSGASPTPGVVVADVPPDVLTDDDERAWHLLTVTCDDRGGLLADLSEHIRCCGVDIVSATVATDTDSGLIVDSFAARGLLLPCACEGPPTVCAAPCSCLPPSTRA
jgi:UTP:GlnB (protein PII) uridylyltransferase